MTSSVLTLHHLDNSQSFRIIWLLEELGVEYDLKIYPRDTRTLLAPAEYKQLHPAGTAPVISDWEMVLAETNAIIDYLLDKYPDSGLRRNVGEAERINYQYWFHVGLGSITPMLIMLFVFSQMVSKSPWFIRPAIQKITDKASDILPKSRLMKQLRHIEQTLNQSDYLAGHQFSAADIVVAYSLEVIDKRFQIANLAEEFPKTKAYLRRLQLRPAYQRGVKKSGGIN